MINQLKKLQEKADRVMEEKLDEKFAAMKEELKEYVDKKLSEK